MNRLTNQSPPTSIETNGERIDLTADQRVRMRRAEALASSARLHDRRRAQIIAREVEAEVAAWLERGQVSRGIFETVRLEVARVNLAAVNLEAAGALGRDDIVDMSPKVGYCRLKERDGLRSLFEAGRLTATEYEAGSIYRRLYEDAASSGGRSQLDDRVKSTTADVVAIGLKRAKASLLKTRIDVAVAVQLKSEPVALQALRLVAGEGRSVRTMVKGSKQFDRTLDALRRALGVATAEIMSK